jgi:hypothetical protein
MCFNFHNVIADSSVLTQSLLVGLLLLLDNVLEKTVSANFPHFLDIARHYCNSVIQAYCNYITHYNAIVIMSIMHKAKLKNAVETCKL